MRTSSIRATDRRRQEPPCPSVQWHDSAGAAAQRMHLAGVESLDVLVGNEPIGRITRRDLERCANRGNWLEAVMVRDLLNEAHDTCN